MSRASDELLDIAAYLEVSAHFNHTAQQLRAVAARIEEKTPVTSDYRNWPAEQVAARARRASEVLKDAATELEKRGYKVRFSIMGEACPAWKRELLVTKVVRI
jgi:hypothetical protein